MGLDPVDLGVAVGPVPIEGREAVAEQLDVAARRLDMEVSEEELERRRAAWTPPAPRFERGYGLMFSGHIEQAPEGCDFDFLKTGYGRPVAEPEIF